jgi:hypothetical protein
MSEPGSVPPSPVSPFQPRPIEPKAGDTGGGGCGKPVVIGCVAALLLGAIVVLGAIYYIGSKPEALGKLMQVSLTQTESGLMQQLPADVTAEERARLQTAFADVRKKLQAGKPDPVQLQELNLKMFEVARKGRNITRQDVLELTESLERFAQGQPVHRGAGGS